MNFYYSFSLWAGEGKSFYRIRNSKRGIRIEKENPKNPKSALHYVECRAALNLTWFRAQSEIQENPVDFRMGLGYKEEKYCPSA
jgi:hypothetical protein